jgi:molybdopterin/thiamine biosynthesis adenylyltransferase/molybdopterin converting factor small subunit
MAVSVYIPTPFRRLTGNRERVTGEGNTVREVLTGLNAEYPGFAELLYDEHQRIPAHINIYLNNKEIHGLQGEATVVADGDELAVIPAIAGGAGLALTPDQVTRYSRHIIMPQVGPVGQRKLMGAKVLVVGAGGLGSPVALYLALAGIGTIGIVDFDVVDLTNLQRQILHQTDDVGKAKVISARETLNAYNPEVNIVTHEEPLLSDNAMQIISQYDIVVNGADNFATRYLVNDACYLAGKPLVDGAILLFDGRASTYIPGKGCYRCVFPEPPPPGMVPSCAEAGVLGALCGTVGTIQATVVLKLILDVGEPLAGRLLLYDALSMDFRVVKTRRDPNCPLCGDNPTVTELIDYDAFCGAPTHKEGTPVAAG